MGTLDTEIGAEVRTETSTDSERERARKRLQTRRDFGSHVVAYVVINAFLVGVWAFTGAGYFWPAWVLGGWGAGLVLHAWDAFAHRQITDADIDAELHRHRR
jgi:2TM domain